MFHAGAWAPDGWIYWTNGDFAQQTYERPGKAPLEPPAQPLEATGAR